MSQTRLLLGVDGGNSKSICLVSRPDGEVIGAGRALGCADIHATDPESALGVIAAAVEAAGPLPPHTELSCVFSLAGADWPDDIELLRGLVWTRWPDAEVVNDGIGALRASVPAGPGVVVVCGTGAVTAARGSDGRSWHSGFWQGPQGAHELGVKSLLQLVRSELGIDGPTSLTRAVLDVVGEPNVEAVLHRWTQRDRSARLAPATLAPTLLDVAETTDPAALAIVSEHGRSLGQYALAAARRVGIVDAPFALALAGGVFRHPSRLLADSLIETVMSGAREVALTWPDLPPAAGALLLAFDRAGLAVSSEIQGRVKASLPSDSLFDSLVGPSRSA